jgi:hypothetical protein
MTDIRFANDKFEPFIDPIGRVSDKARNDEQGITDNPLLFTGEAALLLAKTGQLTITSMLFLEKMLTDCTVVDGLFRRHPESMQKQYAIPRNKISHDEYNGIMFMAAAIPAMKRHAEAVVAYGQKYCWQFNDIHPRANFFKSFINSPIDTFLKLQAYLKDIKNNPQDTNSVDLRHDGSVVSLSSLRQPRDIAFYKLVAGYSPSLFNVLWLCTSIVLTSYKTIEEGSRGGTILMAWFRNVALNSLKLKGFKGFLIRQSIKFFDSKLTKKYSAKYPAIIARLYWDRVGTSHERHPMIYLIQKYLDQ